MKTTTALVGIGAAAVAGIGLYFALRKPEEEKATASTTPTKGAGPTSGSGQGNSRGSGAPVPDHPSIDKIVDAIHGNATRGIQTMPSTDGSRKQQTVGPQTMNPTGSDADWAKAKAAGL